MMSCMYYITQCNTYSVSQSFTHAILHDVLYVLQSFGYMRVCVIVIWNTVIWVYESIYYRHTGWRRLIGSPKLQIIFQKGATKYRSLLRTYKDKGSYESSHPVCSSVYKVLCKVYRSLLQKSPIKETIFCKRDSSVYKVLCKTLEMGWLRLVGSLKL